MSNYRNDETERYAEMFRALSNPHRLKIFLRLLTCCPPGAACTVDEAQKYCVGDLGADLDIAPSTLSHHIKALSQAGLLRLERRGKYVDCRVDPAIVDSLIRFFSPARERE